MRKYFRSIFISILIYFVDALVYSQGGLALITLVVVALVMLPKILMALLKKNRKLCGERIVRAGIYLFMAAMVLVTVALNNRLAFSRAEKIIQACDDYRLEYRRYPDGLEELAPEFIPRIPPAKFSLAYSNFIYISGENRHLLVYYAIPPFGRRVYNLESASWSYLD